VIQVVSAVMGGYDPIDPWIDQTVDYRRTVFTDSVNQPTPVDAYGTLWPMHLPHMHPRMAAKLPKCLPHMFVEATSEILWVDGSIVPRRSDFLEHIVSHSGSLCQFVHHERPDGSLWQEYEASEWQGKYSDLPLTEQVQWYESRGMDMHFGVWATGVMLHRCFPFHGWAELDEMGREWLYEQTRWGYQDQISQPYVLWRAGIKPSPLTGAVIGNPYFDLIPHASDR
jgi:hypothetical protein